MLYILRHESAFFCSSSVKSEPVWLAPWEAQIFFSFLLFLVLFFFTFFSLFFFFSSSFFFFFFFFFAFVCLFVCFRLFVFCCLFVCLCFFQAKQNVCWIINIRTTIPKPANGNICICSTFEANLRLGLEPPSKLHEINQLLFPPLSSCSRQKTPSR